MSWLTLYFQIRTSHEYINYTVFSNNQVLNDCEADIKENDSNKFDFILGYVSTKEKFAMTCQSIRIGPYKIFPTEKVFFTKEAIFFNVPFLCTIEKNNYYIGSALVIPKSELQIKLFSGR